MKKTHLLPLSLSILSLSGPAWAQPEGSSADPAAPLGSDEPLAPTAVAVPAGPDAALAAAPATPPAGPPAAPGPAAEPGREPAPLRRTLFHTAQDVGTTRLVEGVTGLTAAGAMFGVGFAAQAEDMTWSHVLWVTSGVAAAGSLFSLIVPTDFEKLARDSDQKSDAELRAEWKKQAEAAKMERQFGGLFGTLVGAGAITFGVLVLEDEVGDLSDDNRKILGTSLVAGGALGITDALVHWIVPSTIERGYALTEPAPAKLQFGAAPTPGGFSAGLSGCF